MNWPYPLWIAHRGAGKLAPENTLAAFRHGASFGYRAFECDVKLSADGQPFLLHDATLERTTDGRGVAGKLDWATLSRLDAGGWHSRSYAGEPLPTLEAIARYVLRNGFALNVEIKPTPGTETSTGAAVARRCAELWAASRTSPAAPPLLTSFQPAALQAALAEAPEPWPAARPLARGLARPGPRAAVPRGGGALCAVRRCQHQRHPCSRHEGPGLHRERPGRGAAADRAGRRWSDH
jgi:glycerophosphoryl diester phosphodiesterase